MEVTDYFSYDHEAGYLMRKSSGKLCISKAKGTAYVKVSVQGKFFQYHNVVWECCNGKIPNGFTVDHIDRDKLNNKIDNLRLADNKQQTYNTKSHGSTSKYKGVDFNKKANKYFSRIYIEGKSIWLGSFTKELDAAKAYEEAAKKYHGDYYIGDSNDTKN